MLVRLSIRDVVLIERLDLEFQDGLGVFTGETGAGKSILLDSLGLALGDRADSGLVRHGADQLVVTAHFDLPDGHPAHVILRDQGIDGDRDGDGGSLILRRTVSKDGRSKASVNDQPASVGLLRRLGDTLVEVHGQFETHGLLDPATHRAVLDAYAGVSGPLAACRASWRELRAAAQARTLAEADVKRARAEEDVLRHTVEELSLLAPKPGEEGTLADRRQTLMNGEKLAEGLRQASEALDQGGGVLSALRAAQRALERVAPMVGGQLDPVVEALDRATIEAGEAVNQLEHATAGLDLDPRRLEEVEERLFALRAAARKHGVAVDALPDVLERARRSLAALEDGGEALIRLARAEQAARAAYVEAARTLSKARKAAALTLDSAVSGELPPLKLDKARFVTQVAEMPEDQWSQEGLDQVAFLVATNPGAPPGPIGKIASGGELARFMLALKVVLARTSPIPTLVFDEVDAGIGGATAAAVGERLGRLAERLQVLVVTHSPQVAARGAHHYKVAKATDGAKTTTTVLPLPQDQRLEEIARMLSGETITPEARAAAASLMT